MDESANIFVTAGIERWNPWSGNLVPAAVRLDPNVREDYPPATMHRRVQQVRRLQRAKRDGHVECWNGAQLGASVRFNATWKIAGNPCDGAIAQSPELFRYSRFQSPLEPRPEQCVNHQRRWINPIAEAIVRAVERLGIKGAHVRGLGDVAIGERKILGSSLYANRKVALYQGSLLVDPDLSLIPIYLPHPSKEPDYRRGRNHLDFVTSLAEQGYDGGLERLKRTLAEELTRV
jgi:hypothetical protein